MQDDIIKAPRRIGIMGGTFDPPHYGHFLIAERAAAQLRLDKVIFVPNGEIGYKSTDEAASGIDRYNMVRAVAADNPRFVVSGIEVLSGDMTYTANTLKKLRESGYGGDELFFLVGADSLDYMERWYRPDVIFGLCTVAVAARPGFDEERICEKMEFLQKNFDAKIERVSIPLIDISSSEMRRIVKSGGSIRYMTDDRIVEYILKHGLYGGGNHD